MKRILGTVLLGALAGCAGHGASSGGTTSTNAPSAPNALAPRQELVDPSELSPEQVRLVQRSLADRGFAVSPSGTFDDRTHVAITDFQRARGLQASGQLDTPTIQALGLDPRDVSPVRGVEPQEDEEVHGAGGG